jgi:hypothetical protein
MKNFPLFQVFLFICGLIVGCWLHGCGCGKPGFEVTSKTDTVYIPVHDSATSKPEITFIEGGHIPDKVDTVTVIQKFYERVAYADTVRLGTNSIYIYDTLSQNSFATPRRILLDGKLPVVTNTITIRDKPRGQVYIGAGGMWNVQEKLLGVGPSLMYKSRRDQVFEVGAMVNTASQLSYFAGLKFKISLKKR